MDTNIINQIASRITNREGAPAKRKQRVVITIAVEVPERGRDLEPAEFAVTLQGLVGTEMFQGIDREWLIPSLCAQHKALMSLGEGNGFRGTRFDRFARHDVDELGLTGE